MKDSLNYFYNKLKIKVLLALSPVTLFSKIALLGWYSETLHKWVNLHVSNKSTHILEVGCASGYLTEYINMKGNPVTGIDLSQKMIRSAKKRNAEIDFQVANAKKLLFKNEEFDVVVSASLINIVPEPEKVIREMQRVCKKGGWISFLVPREDFKNDDLQALSKKLKLSGFSLAALEVWHERAPKMSAEEIDTLLNKAGVKTHTKEFYLDGMVLSVSIHV